MNSLTIEKPKRFRPTLAAWRGLTKRNTDLIMANRSFWKDYNALLKRHENLKTKFGVVFVIAAFELIVIVAAIVGTMNAVGGISLP